MKSIGTLYDWTREGDVSPFYGIVAYDEDLGCKVINMTNGGFIYLDDIEVTKVERVVHQDQVKEFLQEEKQKFPEEDFAYIEKLASTFKSF